MKPRIYIDTSVFGGLFDSEFEEFTKPLFDRIHKGEFIVLFSNLTEEELKLAPQNVKSLVNNLELSHTEFIDENAEAIELANQYIIEKVVGKTSFADCLHIALATVSHADYLISWNFKHIVNIDRIRGYNSINLKLGYKAIEIRSPRDLMKYED